MSFNGTVQRRESPAAASPDRGDSAATCFHCNEPLLAGQTWPVQYAGQTHDVCCPGCQAVFEAIHGAGLEAYYQHRQAPAVSPDALATVRAQTEDWQAYDDEASLARFCTPGDSLPGSPDARPFHLVLHIDGLRCGACVWLIEQALRAVPGISDASVNYGNARCHVHFDASRLRLSDIIARIHALGYGCAPTSAASREQAFEQETRSHRQRLFVAGLAMMQAMMFSLPGYLSAAGDIDPAYVSLLRWAGLAVVTPALLYSGWPIFWAAWRDIRQRHASMDTPVAIALLIAFVASVAATLTGHGEVYFDSIAMFLFLLLGARYLERQARRRATQAARDLELVVPEVVERHTPVGDFERVPADRLQPGDTIRVRQGDRLPVDASVISGNSTVDQSLISGESRPVSVGDGDVVPGGAVVSGAPLMLRVTRSHADSTLSLIRALADRGQSEKPAIVRFADWLASRFIVFVLATAVLAGLAWWLIEPGRAMHVAVAVMIIACPCALSLATPAALAAATDSLLRARVLITRGHVFEALNKVTDVVLDKTGTLTRGRPDVTEIQLDQALDEQQRITLLSLVARALSADAHPMAQAIVRRLNQQQGRSQAGRNPAPETLEWTVTVEQVQAGAGIRADITGPDGQTGELIIGSAAWCGIKPNEQGEWRQLARDPFDAVSEVFVALAALTGTGLSGTGFSNGVAARFSLTDQLRTGAEQTVRALRNRGLMIHLVTGDRLPAAERVARELNIAQVSADVTPEGKARYVQQLQGNGRVVLMVGDGINDAPVLGCADVSVAVGQASSLARSTADVVCLGDNGSDGSPGSDGSAGSSVSTLPSLLSCADRTIRVVRQNVAWAVGYNTCAMPLAVMGLVPPAVAAIGMALSSLLVVANAMRLTRLSVRVDGQTDRLADSRLDERGGHHPDAASRPGSASVATLGEG